MVKINISENLYEDFLEEKENLDSTLSTIEILNDDKLLKEIKTGITEINEGKSKTLSFEDINNL